MTVWLRGLPVAIMAASMLARPVFADDRTITAAVGPVLAADGFFEYILPRFSLKTGIRVRLVEPDAQAGADIRIGPQQALGSCRPFLTRNATVFCFRLATPPPGTRRAETAERLAAWLSGTVGSRTIDAFNDTVAPDYAAAGPAPVGRPRPNPTGDVGAGERLAYRHCGRCHVVGPQNRMGGLGSTPSFRVLRTLADWEDRFRAFFALNPHPAFTQVAGVTDGWRETLPSPIAPLRITPAQLDAIVAYAATLAPADLGVPLRHQ